MKMQTKMYVNHLAGAEAWLLLAKKSQLYINDFLSSFLPHLKVSEEYKAVKLWKEAFCKTLPWDMQPTKPEATTQSNLLKI